MTDRSPNEELALLGGQICVNNAANTIEMYSDVVVGNSTVGINAFLSKNSYFRSAEVILASNNQNNVQFIDTTALYPNGSVTPKFLQVSFNTGQIGIYQPDANLYQEGAQIVLGYKGHYPNNKSTTTTNNWNIDVFGNYGTPRNLGGEPVNAEVQFPDSLRFFHYDGTAQAHIGFGIVPANNGPWTTTSTRIYMGRDTDPDNNYVNINFLNPINLLGNIGPSKDSRVWVGTPDTPFDGITVNNGILWVSNVNQGVGALKIQTDGNFVLDSCYQNNSSRTILHTWSYANNSANSDYEGGGKGAQGNGLFIDSPLVIKNGIIPYGKATRGNAGQVLTSTGAAFPGVEWKDVPGGPGSVNTDAQYVWSNQHTFNANVVINGNAFIKGQIVDKNTSAGSSGQILSSTGTGVQWINPTVNTSAQYTWTNTHTFSSDVIHAVDKNITLKTPSGGNTSFVSQNDNTFVFYTPNGAVWSVPTSNTGSFRMLRDVEFNAGIVAGFQGSKGTAGQVLSSTGTGIQWTNNTPKFYQYIEPPDTNLVANSMFLGAFIRTNSPTGFSIPSQFTTINGAYFYIYNASPSSKDLQITTNGFFEISPAGRYLTSMNVVPIGVIKVIVQDAGTKFVVLQEGGTSLREMMNEPPAGSSDLQARIIELENRLLDLESKTINKTKRQ